MDKQGKKGFRSGFVAVIGRPNAGKSTLLNTLLGQKVLIISDKPQATRNRIRCILTEERGQVIFFDTPGIHKPKHRLGEYMVAAAKSALQGVDMAVCVVDVSVPFGTGDEYVFQIVKESGIPCILALNKIDLITKEELMVKIATLSKLADFREVIPISALHSNNTAKLMDLIFEALQPGPMFFPDDVVIDQPEKFVVAELIREKLMNLTREEVPHAVAVVVENMEEKKTLIKIEAVILVERDSQKGIVIGKDGCILKEVGKLAREEIETLLDSKVFLQLWVKVKKDWRNQNTQLRDLGYNLKDLNE
ncbi:GTPase Era [Dehalobacter sp. DCM]|uniref:GTPase Era n=1 Tax=Dehalobacter sp. DCM TaxID=2907827 RepID=UPI0030816395|nr:GTPase Era [Dehalobacter sp. DCM]